MRPAVVSRADTYRPLELDLIRLKAKPRESRPSPTSGVRSYSVRKAPEYRNSHRPGWKGVTHPLPDKILGSLEETAVVRRACQADPPLGEYGDYTGGHALGRGAPCHNGGGVGE